MLLPVHNHNHAFLQTGHILSKENGRKENLVLEIGVDLLPSCWSEVAQNLHEHHFDLFINWSIEIGIEVTEGISRSWLD